MVSRRVALTTLSVLAVQACSAPRTVEGAGPGSRSIDHRWGSTEVPTRVSRVVALGAGDMEAAIALGLAPVGGSDVYGLVDTVRPWVSSALTGREPELLDWRDPPYETIARLRPDLILFVNAPDDRRTFDVLSRIAPTVAAPPGHPGSFGVPWRSQLDLVGAALGRDSAAERVAGQVDALLASARDRLSLLSGVRTTAGLVVEGSVYLWPAVDPRVALLEELGLRCDQQPDRQDGGTGYLVPVSPERYDLLETDLLYLACVDEDGRVDPALDRSPTFQTLDVVRRGRVVYAPGPAAVDSLGPRGSFASAFGIGGALGIPACLPELEAELRGALRAV